MFSKKTHFRLRLFFFVIASGLNTAFAVLLYRTYVPHSDICWWLFSLETVGLVYYSVIELWMQQFMNGRISLLGIIGSAVATQGMLSSSLEPPLSIILQLLTGCNLGFIFVVGLRVRCNRSRYNASLHGSVHEPWCGDIRGGNGGMHLENSSGKQEGREGTELPIEDKPEWDTEDSESTSTDDGSFTFERTSFVAMRDLLSLLLGIAGLCLGTTGWVLNFSAWIKECLDKSTCSELSPQWWTLGQALLFFFMYILANILSRSFEILAAYSVLVSIPVSIFVRVANAARSDFFYLKNQESAHETWNSVGTVIGSSLLAATGALLVISLGILNFSWKSPAPVNQRSFRAILSLFGIIGVVVLGHGLHSVQDVCDDRRRCDWYYGLWVEFSLQVVIVVFGILSSFGKPGESVRAMLVALTVVPSYAYVINAAHFLGRWDATDSISPSDRATRFSAAGLVILLVVNYLWILSWGWGRSECQESQKDWSVQHSGITKTLLSRVRSFTSKNQTPAQTHNVSDGLEMGRVNNSAPTPL